MRWPAFILLSTALGFCQAVSVQAHGLPAGLARVEVLFLLALVTARRCEPAYIPVAFWWCGLVRDLFLGARLGAGALLFLLVSPLVGELRRWDLLRHPLALALAAFLLSLPVGALRPLLEYLSLRPFSLPGWWNRLLAASALAAAVAPVLDLLLAYTPLRTWRLPGRTYGLPEA